MIIPIVANDVWVYVLPDLAPPITWGALRSYRHPVQLLSQLELIRLVLQEKRYRSMQEHIRRAHPNHYIPKLPATEESFLLMVNTPLEQRAQLSPPEPAQPRRPHGEFFFLPPRMDCCFLLSVLQQSTDGYTQMWRRKETFMLLTPARRLLLELLMNPTQRQLLRQLRWHNCITIDWPQTGIQTWFVALRAVVGFEP